MTDIDGNEYVDFLCGYGPMILVIENKKLTEVVIRQIRGQEFLLHPHTAVSESAGEKLSELVPCSEMSIFLKTGSDCYYLLASVLQGPTQTGSR